jgi:hypothetical protein
MGHQLFLLGPWIDRLRTVSDREILAIASVLFVELRSNSQVTVPEQKFIRSKFYELLQLRSRDIDMQYYFLYIHTFVFFAFNNLSP